MKTKIFVLFCIVLVFIYLCKQIQNYLNKRKIIENIQFDKTNHETIQILFNHSPDSKEYNHGSPGA